MFHNSGEKRKGLFHGADFSVSPREMMIFLDPLHRTDPLNMVSKFSEFVAGGQLSRDLGSAQSSHFSGLVCEGDP